jgi:hypothetical protein
MTKSRVGALLLSGALLSALLVTPGAQPAAAAPAEQFDAGNIISDAEFFDSGAMNQAQVQQFLQGQSCAPRDAVPCLTTYSQETPSKPAAGAGHCAAYAGQASESASQIIWKVGQACGISPRVLLVLLQKEQSLITAPSSYGYARATGYGCPDTSGCDSAYFGFFNQVYRAAWQFRQYTLKPTQWRYRVGNNTIQFHPNASCGSSVVTVANQATANLYNYTPYQPNAAAISNLYGTGDGCSSYGNRNFWRMYYDWFGSPTGHSPRGQLENMQPVPGGVGMWGWAFDTDTPDPVAIHIYVDGQMVLGTTASADRPDIAARFGTGPERGFGLVVPVPGGNHTVCIYALNVGPGANLNLGCYSVNVGGTPVGRIDNIQPRPGGMGVWGWAVDPDTIDPIQVHFYVDGRMVRGITANGERGDLGLLKPGYGTNHAFGETLPMPAGQHQICAYAINVGSGGSNPSLGCYNVVAGGSPLGVIDPLTSGIGKVTASGWLLDPDTTDPIWVHFYLDGVMVKGILADQPRSDLGVYDSFGDKGFSTDLPASPGRHNLCVYALNVGSGSTVQAACRQIDVGGSPKGVLENGQPGFGTIGAWGWGYDPDTADSAAVHIYVDGQMRGGFMADVPRPDLTSIPSAYGVLHGFGAIVPAAPGGHEVCVYLLNSGYGQNNLLGCFQTVVSGDPVAAVENIQPVSGGLGVWGFAVDPDATGPTMVNVYMDDVLVSTVPASTPRSDLGPRFPGYGDGHAFGAEFPAAAGSHKICVTAVNQGAGGDLQLGCNTVTK